MDASLSSALVASSALAGAAYTLPGPQGLKIVLHSVDDRTAGSGPLGPIDNLVGLETTVSYTVPLHCDHLA